jgi:hypothetical protein
MAPTQRSRSVTLEILVGTTTGGGSADFFGDGEAALSRFQCATSGTVDTLSFTQTASGFTQLRLAIYADSAGVPGALLGTSALTTDQTAGTKSLALTPSVAVTLGTFYWLGIMGTNGSPQYTAASGTGERHKTVGAGATAFPNPWGGADTTGSNTLPIAGEGTAGSATTSSPRTFNAIPFIGGGL